MDFDITLINKNNSDESIIINVKYGTKIRSLKYQLEIPDCHADDIKLFNMHGKELPDNIPLRGMGTFFYQLPDSD